MHRVYFQLGMVIATVQGAAVEIRYSRVSDSQDLADGEVERGQSAP